MPIKNLSDYRRMPRLGKIRLGIMVETGTKRYPKQTDYFVCPTEIQAIYGKEPKELDILIPSGELEAVFSQYYKMYGKSTGLKCRGDGERAYRFDKDKDTWTLCDCLGKDCTNYIDGNCKERAHLMVMLPKVERVGCYQIDTSSINSIININSSLDLIKAVTGRFHMIPCVLSLRPREVQVKGVKKTVYCLGIELHMSLVELRRLGRMNPMDMGLLPGETQTPALPPEVHEDLPSPDDMELYEEIEVVAKTGSLKQQTTIKEFMVERGVQEIKRLTVEDLRFIAEKVLEAVIVKEPTVKDEPTKNKSLKQFE